MLCNKFLVNFFCLGLIVSASTAVPAKGLLRERLRQKFTQTNQDHKGTASVYKIAGLDVAVWKPRTTSESAPLPLIVFSHGYHGLNTQSVAIMQALADAGYMVVAPNHKDALLNGSMNERPANGFGKAGKWSDKDFKDRGDDITKLIDALKKDSQWSAQIDWNKVALAGHSLGGYTALALAGAWPSWKLSGVNIKAVLALSPYCQPFVLSGDLGHLHVPVMYQSGTRDLGILPFIKKSDGAFDKTASPAYLVSFNKASHFAWTNFERDKNQQQAINYYCVAFLDRYVKGNASAQVSKKLSGVVDLEEK